MCEDIVFSQPGCFEAGAVVKNAASGTECPEQSGIEDGTAWSILRYPSLSRHLSKPAAPPCVKHIVEPEGQDVLSKTFVDFTA